MRMAFSRISLIASCTVRTADFEAVAFRKVLRRLRHFGTSGDNTSPSSVNVVDILDMAPQSTTSSCRETPVHCNTFAARFVHRHVCDKMLHVSTP